jgi:hypothetical protein
MAYTQGLCSAIQVNLNDIAGANAPALKRDRIGMVDSLMSDVNRSGFTAQIVPTNGKIRAVQVNYQAQACDSAVNTSCDVNCTPDVTPQPSETLITDFSCLKYKMTFDENEMRKLCEADSVWVGQTIMNAMNAVNVKLDKAVLALMTAGAYVDDAGVTQSGPLNVPLFNTNGQVNPMSWAYIKHIYENGNWAGMPIIVGGGSMDLWAKAQSIACCNTNYGMDMSRAIGETYFYTDRFAASILGDGDGKSSIVYAPGVMQLVFWNKYVGDYAKKNDSFEHGTIVDPFSGMVYDLKTNYDDCAEVWYVEIGLNWNLFKTPNAYCNEADGWFQLTDCSAGGDIACP